MQLRASTHANPDGSGRTGAVSLRRLWAIHVRDFWFEDSGLEHNPGFEASELMRSWYAAERHAFLSWIARRGPPPLARAACLALAAKCERTKKTAFAFGPKSFARS